MTDNEDEDKPVRGKPSAYWAEVRAQEKDAAREHTGGTPDNYTGGYRGVRSVHGGAQYVRPEDILGDYDLCWCGKPADHFWPGKAGGAVHPPASSVTEPDGEEVSAVPVETPRIERTMLRAYHSDLVDVILQSVNVYHTKYRQAKSGSILLFPPDGSKPFKMNPRADSRQVKTAQQWFVRHVLIIDPETGESKNPLVKDPMTTYRDYLSRNKRDRAEHGTEAAEVVSQNIHDADDLADEIGIDHEVLRRLAEEINGPEHPVPHEEPESPAAGQPDPAAETVAVPDPAPDEVDWQPYLTEHSTKPSHWVVAEIDGIRHYRCLYCGQTYTNNRSLGGHIRTRHTNTADLWGPKARAKASQTNADTRLVAKVHAAIEHLQRAIGDEAGSVTELQARIQKLEADAERGVKALTRRSGEVAERDRRVTELEAEVADLNEALANHQETIHRLETEVEPLKVELAEWQAKYGELDAKMQLMREALGL